MNNTESKIVHNIPTENVPKIEKPETAPTPDEVENYRLIHNVPKHSRRKIDTKNSGCEREQ